MINKLGYNTIVGFECLNSCITNYYNFLKEPIYGYHIFFNGNGFNINYDKKKKILKTSIHEANYLFLKDINNNIIKDNLLNKQDALDFISNTIHNDLCIILKVSSSDLNYNNVYSQINSLTPHYINVIGIKLKDRKIFVSDGFVPTYNPSTFEGWIDLDTILKSWEKMNFKYIIIKKPYRINYSTIKIETLGNIKNSIYNYLYNGYHKDNYSHGVLAMESFFDYFTHNKLIDLDVYDLIYKMRLNGFVNFRRYIQQALICENISMEYQQNYKSIIDKWNLILLQLLKVEITKKQSDFDNCITKMYDLNLREINFFNELLDNIDKIL